MRINHLLCVFSALACVSVMAEESSPLWGALEPAATEPTQEGVLTFSDLGEPFLNDENIKRRDPSDIIKVDGTYYVWYTKILKGTPGYPGGWGGTIWYATSQDGKVWKEQGMALDKSPVVSDWDSHGVYTPNIARFNGKFVMGYTAQSDAEPEHKNRRAHIGIAISDSPEGPWKKVKHNPVIPAGNSLKDADGFICDDTVFLIRDKKLYLYYKGWAKMHDSNGKTLRYKAPKGAKGRKGGSTFLLGAVSDDPETKPFVKFEQGPLHRAHEMVLWPEKDGEIGSLCMGWGELLYYRSKDGVRFVPITSIASRQGAAGVYRADFESDWDGARPSWGLKMTGTGLQRFSIQWPDKK